MFHIPHNYRLLLIWNSSIPRYAVFCLTNTALHTGKVQCVSEWLERQGRKAEWAVGVWEGQVCEGWWCREGFEIILKLRWAIGKLYHRVWYQTAVSAALSGTLKRELVSIAAQSVTPNLVSQMINIYLLSVALGQESRSKLSGYSGSGIFRQPWRRCWSVWQSSTGPLALRVAHPKVGIPMAGVGRHCDRPDHVGLRRTVEGLCNFGGENSLHAASLVSYSLGTWKKMVLREI